MKKIFKTFALAAAIAAFGATAAQATVVKIETKGFTNDTITVSQTPLEAPFKTAINDVVVLKKGKAEYVLNSDKPTMLYLIPEFTKTDMGNGNKVKSLAGVITLYLNSNEKTTKIKAVASPDRSLSYAVVEGSETNKAVAKAYANMQGDAMPYTRLLEDYKAGKLTDEQTGEKLRSIYGALMAKVDALIAANPKDEANLYLTTEFPYRNITDAAGKLDESVKTSIIYPGFDYMNQLTIRQMEEVAARQRNAANAQEGVEAKDFTLTDINGNQFTLSSLRGKYVILDFWGSWCGWCIKGMPQLKEYYAAHSDVVEVVGVDCRDTDEKWRKTVARLELPWIQVRVPEDVAVDDNVPVTYAIEGYPTKFLINKEGKIALKVVGEDPSFYEQVDAIIAAGK